jgi:hypothetical protein
MNGSAKWGGGCPTSYGHGEQHGGMPLIPAPVACVAMLFGVMIGIMIGRKRSMMHGQGMGMMMHGPGMGVERGGGDWMMRKKMMGGMGMHHHHHGYGMPECKCAEGAPTVAEGDQPTTEE